MAVSAHDVARALRASLPRAGLVKVHKLLYYAQGWHLAMMGEPMFREEVEAWVNGPVVAALWTAEKRGAPPPPPRALSDGHRAALDYVIERYGRLTGTALIRLTHNEDPWRRVSELDDAWVDRRPVIGLDALRAWFERDDECLVYRAEVDRLRLHGEIYSFGPLVLPDRVTEPMAPALVDG